MLLPFISDSSLLLVVLISFVAVVVAQVLQRIIYPTDHGIDTSLPESTRIREKAAVPLSIDSDDDQVASVDHGKVSASTL